MISVFLLITAGKTSRMLLESTRSPSPPRIKKITKIWWVSAKLVFFIDFQAWESSTDWGDKGCENISEIVASPLTLSFYALPVLFGGVSLMPRTLYMTVLQPAGVLVLFAIIIHMLRVRTIIACHKARTWLGCDFENSHSPLVKFPERREHDFWTCLMLSHVCVNFYSSSSEHWTCGTAGAWLSLLTGTVPVH